MSRDRIIYKGRIIATGLKSHRSDHRDGQIELAVRSAIAELDDREREFIIQYYYAGQTYRQIGERLGVPRHRLETIHRRAIRRLRALLGAFVRDRYGVADDVSPGCPLCASPNRAEIDRIIRSRDPDGTWRPVIRALKQRFGLKITAVQTLISHEKYHVINEVNHKPGESRHDREDHPAVKSQGRTHADALHFQRVAGSNKGPGDQV